MGSSYTTLAADAMARYKRLAGAHVEFVTGCDEHGEKIAQAAAKAGRTPQEHVDAIAGEYAALWRRLDISNDRFVRTTSATHRAFVTAFLERVWDRGDVYQDAYEGHYCVDCEEYKDEKELVNAAGEPEEGADCCAIHRRPCPIRKEENYFFKCSSYQSQVEALLSAEPSLVSPAFRRNEIATTVAEGVRDFSISRAASPWGIPVPRDESQTVYVWFDALLGYLSALYLPHAGADGDGNGDATRDVTLEEAREILEAMSTRGVEGSGGKAGGRELAPWPVNVHVIGKDILRFHSVYWPAMLTSAGLPTPSRVFSHGFLTKDGLKMGKSMGNTLDPIELLDAYGADAVRFYFLKSISFGNDGDFNEERFINVVNDSLANDVGNLVNRCLNLLRKNGGLSFPLSASEAADNLAKANGGEPHALVTTAEQSVRVSAAAYEEMDFSRALDAALAITQLGNRFIQELEPWALYKADEDAEEATLRAHSGIVVAMEALRIAMVLLAPAVPGLASRVYAQLGLDASVLRGGVVPMDELTAWGGLQEGASFPKPKPVFARLEEMVLSAKESAKAAA